MVSGSALVSINEVNLRRAGLVLGWVRVSTVSILYCIGGTGNSGFPLSSVNSAVMGWE